MIKVYLESNENLPIHGSKLDLECQIILVYTIKIQIYQIFFQLFLNCLPTVCQIRTQF